MCFVKLCSQGAAALQEPRLTNAKFTRIVMDAALVDEKLTAAKVDVTFSRVCGNSPYMTLANFRDAMVRLAAIKYPQLGRTEAVLEVFKNLATFQGQTKDVFSELDDAVLNLLEIASGNCNATPRRMAELKFGEPESYAEQELWWDLAKAFIVPVPLTVSELEPHKQRICNDQSFLLSILNDAQKCNHSWQVLQFVSEFLVSAASILRHAEAELRDEATRIEQPVGGAPPPPPGLGEAPPASQSTVQGAGEATASTLSSKAPPPAPPAPLAPGHPKEPSETVKKEPSESRASKGEAGLKEVVKSSPEERARSSGRRRRRDHREEPTGERESPRERRGSRSRRRERERDRKRRKSPESEERDLEGGKEKKKRLEPPPEPRDPPPRYRGQGHWGPQEPSYPPPRREQGHGWEGDLPRTSHPRWHQSQNKGQVKRAKQELYNQRRRR
eukprot:s1973_g7.t1